MRLAIINYGAGNVFSVENACRRLGYEPELTDDPDLIRQADKVIFPGVGNAVSAMKALDEKGLSPLIPALTKPLLGICLGMQLLFEKSDEGNTACLGAIEGEVPDFKKYTEPGRKVPHMGWNLIDNLSGDLFKGVSEGAYVYFVHSYFVPVNEYATASSYYGLKFTAAIQKDNFYACQFHPEKSGETGMVILKNFLEL